MGTIFYKGKKYSSTDDYKVSQRGDITTNSNFELLLSTTADSDLTEIGELKKGKGLYYNPYSKELNVLNGSIIVGNPDSEAEDYGGVSITKTDILVKNGWFTEFGQDTSLKYCMGQLNTGKVSKSGDTMTGDLTVSGGYSINLNGGNIVLGTNGSSSNDSGDIVWYYGNGQEKMRLYTDNTYGTKRGINYRLFSDDGTALGAGRLVTTDGDTMSGNLTISKTNSCYFIVKTDTYALNTTSNNSMSSTQTIGGWLTRDKNDANLSNIYTNMGSDGAVTLTAYASNKKTDGTNFTNYISIVAKKDGSLTYNVASPANFRSAIGAGTSSLAIGTTSTTAAAGNHNHNGTYCYGSVRIVAGTVVRSVGDVQWFAPFTTAQIKSLLGISATPSANNTYVNYTNGDTSAHNFTLTGTSWMSGVPNAVFSAKKGGTGNVRFNYIIAYFG